jgi:hypothetical protein
VNFLGSHVLPGIVLIIVSSALLLGWELMRFGFIKDARLRWLKNVQLRWLLSCSGLTLGVVSLVLIAIRFLVVQ